MENTQETTAAAPKPKLASSLDLLLAVLDHYYEKNTMLHLHIPVQPDKNPCEYDLFYDGLNFKIYMLRENKNPVSFYLSGDLGILCCQDQVMTEQQLGQFNDRVLIHILNALKEKNFTKEQHPTAIPVPK